MIGKKIKVSDYNFIYGKETTYVNIYASFKNKKSGNKYTIYSYENNNKKINYGTFFQRGKEAVIMASKEDPKEIIKEFINSLLEEKKDDTFEIISLKEIESVQIIDEYTMDSNLDINKLYELTIPKQIVEKITGEPKKKKQISIPWIFFSLFIIVVIAFFFVNPEVIIGKNKEYICTKTYFHSSLPSTINEEISLIFSGKGNITSISLQTDYIFTDTEYYYEFKDKSYFYQYIEEGNTYKFIDENYTYRLFSKIDVAEEYFLPTKESELISYYKDKNYICKAVKENE